MFVLLWLLFSFLILIYYWKENTEHEKLIRKIPGDDGYPLIGNFLDHMIKPQPLFYHNRASMSKYKKIFKMKHFHLSSVVINDPDDIEKLLNTSKYIEKARLYALFRPWLGDGLLVASAEKWRKQRKLLTNAFHFSILKDACKIFDKYGKVFVEDAKKVEGKEYEVHDPIAKFTLFSICQSAMGISLENTSMEITEYRQAVVDIAQCILYRLSRLLLDNNFILDLLPIGKIQKKVVNNLHKFTDRVLQERKSNNNNNNNTVENVNSEESNDENKPEKKRLAMLDLLLSMEKEGKIDEQGIKDEVHTFTFGGHDTTTSAIMFFLLNLANHKDIQDRIVEELKTKINSRDDKITLELINQLPYLDCCYKESLRLYSPVPFFSRHLKEDLKLKNYVIPKNTSVFVLPFDLHRDYTLFPNPFKYDPERFTPENCAKRHPFAFIPFSAGPRNCIGQKYAAFEVKSFIITLLRNFIIHPVTTPNDIRFTTDIVLNTTVPIKVKFQCRDDAF